MSDDENEFRAWLRSNHVTDGAIDAVIAEGITSQAVFGEFVEPEDIERLPVPPVQKKVLKKLLASLAKQDGVGAPDPGRSIPKDELQEYLEQRGVALAGVEGVRRLGVTIPSTLVHLTNAQVRGLDLPPAQTALLLDHVIKPLRARKEREALQEGPLIHLEGVHMNVHNVTDSEVFAAKVIMQAREARQRAISRAQLLANHSKAKFVPSSGFRKCLDVLQKAKVGVLTGGPGSGKTTTAMAVARAAMDSGQRVLVVGRKDPGQPDDRPAELLAILGETEVAEETLVVVDDIFGAFRFHALAFQTWLESLDEVLKLLRSDRSVPWRFLFTSRFDALQVALSRLGRFSTSLFSKDKVVNLSLPAEIPLEERRAIFLKHAELAGQTIQEAVVEQIVSLPLNAVCGFPHACEVFFDFPHLQADPVKFFKAPLQAIKSDLQEIIRDAPAKTTVLLLTLVQGSIDVTAREAIQAGVRQLSEVAPLLESWPETRDVLEAAKNLTHTYLSAEGDRVSFRHQTFYDVFAFLVGSEEPRVVLWHCSMAFIYDRVLAQWALSEPEGLSGGDEENFCIRLSSSYRNLLAERFCKELLEGNLLLVCSHQALQETSFVAAMLERLQSQGSLDRVLHLDDVTGHGCFLCCAAFRQSSELLRQSVQCAGANSFSADEIHAAVLACCLGDNLEVLTSLQELFPSICPLDACVNEKDKGRYPHRIFKGLLPFDAVVPDVAGVLNDQQSSNVTAKTGVTDPKSASVTEETPSSPEEGMKVISRDGKDLKARAELLRKREIGKTLEKKTFYLPVFFQSRTRFLPGYLTPLPLAVHCRSARVLKHMLSSSALSMTDRDHLCLVVALSCLDDDDLMASLVECWPALPHLLQLSSWPGCLESPSPAELEIASQADTTWSPLHVASLYDAPGIVRSLLKPPFSADIEAKSDRMRVTPLVVAAVANRPSCVDVLLSGKAFVDAADSSGITPLMWAVMKDHQEVTLILLQSGADVKAVNEDGDTALIYAARFGHVPMVRLLLPRSDVNYAGEFGHTALIKAAFLGREDALRELLADESVDVSAKATDGSSALHKAAMMGHAGCVKLLQSRMDVNERGANGETALIIAASMGRLEVVQELLANPYTDPDIISQRNYTALEEACYRGHLDIIKALLPFCDVNVPAMSTPLMAACHVDDGDAVALLLSNPDIDLELCNIIGNTALCQAACEGHTKAFRALLPRCDVNRPGAFGRTPLLCAAHSGQKDIVQLLLSDSRVNVNAKDRAGYTALSAAVLNNHVEVVRLLLPHADVNNASTPWQDPPLVTAATRAWHDVIRLLLTDVRIDVNKKNLRGTSAVMAAAYFGHCSTVQLLLSDWRVDINAANREGKTALELAIERNNVDIVKMLLDNVRVDTSALTFSGRALVENAMKDEHSELGRVLQADSRFDRLLRGLSDDPVEDFSRLVSQASSQMLMTNPVFTRPSLQVDNIGMDDIDLLSDALTSGVAAMMRGLFGAEDNSSPMGNAGQSSDPAEGQCADAGSVPTRSREGEPPGEATVVNDTGSQQSPVTSSTPEGAAWHGGVDLDLVQDTMNNLSTFLMNFIEMARDKDNTQDEKESMISGAGVAGTASNAAAKDSSENDPGDEADETVTADSITVTAAESLQSFSRQTDVSPPCSGDSRALVEGMTWSANAPPPGLLQAVPSPPGPTPPGEPGIVSGCPALQGSATRTQEGADSSTETHLSKTASENDVSPITQSCDVDGILLD